ncbi:1-acyl-sn-glycerol-3-phosphate acyltransferase [bacterium]|nr:1-acyl-sn-glycerol-3-phosphate acyltransferase [bacterium]
MKTAEEKKELTKKYMTRKPESYNLFRTIWQWLVTKFWYGLSYTFIYRKEVYGKENIPKTNNYIVVANHLSTLDPPLLANIMPNPVSFMAKRELFEIPMLRIMLDWLGAFAVDRENVGSSTIRTAKSISNTKNWVLGIFPQGTREPAGKITKVTKGFAGLAKSTKCNILPVGILGTDNPKKIPFTGKIIVKIGKVIENTGDANQMMNEWIKAIQELTGFEYAPQS